jgi:hypothetical protein
MRCARWIAEIAAGGIIAMFVLEDSIEHKDFLASPMSVAREDAAGSITDNRCRTGDLVPDAK